MASGGQNVVFYDKLTYKTLYVYGHYAEPVYNIDWSYDSKYLLVVSSKGHPELVRPYSTEAKILQYIKVNGITAASFFNKTHRYISFGCKNGDVAVWDTKIQEIHKKMVSTSSNVNCIDVSNNDNYVSAGCEDGVITLYGLKSNKKMQTITIDSAYWPITSLKYSDKEQGMFGATNDHGYVGVWDIVKRKTPLFIAKNHSSISSGIALSPINTNFFVSVGYDRLICMCDLRTKESVCNRETDFALTSIDMSADGLMMMCGHRKGGILIYDLRNNKEPFLNIAEHSGVVTSVAFQKNIKPCNKEKVPDVSIEQNFSVDFNKSRTNSVDQNNDSFLNLLDDVKENIYYQPGTPNCETDVFIKDLSSPSDNLSSKTVKDSPLTSRNSVEIFLSTNKSLDVPVMPHDNDSGGFVSPTFSLLNLSASKNEIFKSTPKIVTDEHRSSIKEHNQITKELPEVTKSDLMLMKKEFEELKNNTTQIMEMHKSSMLRLHMLLCTQHIQLLNKIESGISTTDTQHLKKEMEKLQNENEMLKYELEIMKSERNKYLTQPSSSKSN